MQLEDKVQKFVSEKIGVDCKKTGFVFFTDTGLSGLDAYTFIGDFAKQFNVDMSDFDFHRYGISDNYSLNPIGIFKIAYHLFFPSKLKSTFSMVHLIKVIENGKWFDPS